MNSLNNKIFISVFLFCIFFAFGEKADAATLFVKPSQTEVSVGNIVNIQISVDTSGKAINNIESIVQFPKDLLEVVSLDNKSSIFSLWVEEPSFSNSIGQATFNGGVPNPGFQGGNGNIISIIFRAKKVGVASIMFSNSAVRENDGLGTDIFSGQRGATISIISITTKEITPVIKPPVSNVAEVSIIKSKTHPDQEKWYSDNAPEFYWDLPKGTIEMRTLIGRSPNGEPTIKYSPSISEKKVDPLADGIYYFSLQIRTANGWSDIHRYRVNIDTTPPKAFSIKFPHGDKNFDPEPIILFNTIDNESGISHYDIKVGDDGPERTVPIVISNPYSLPAQYPGEHTVVVKAIDMAGNSTSASADFTIKALEPPIITYYQDEIESGDSIKIRGTTYPDSDIIIIFRQDEKIISEEHTQSNSSGDFAFFLGKRINPGVYTFTAQVTDRRGAKSNETASLTISVKSAFLNTLVSLVINYLSVAILIILVLGGIIISGIYVWRRYISMIYHMKKESREAEQVLEKSFSILRKDLREHISKLRRAESKRKLTSEEVGFLERFEEELSEAEGLIEKEVRDISDS